MKKIFLPTFGKIILSLFFLGYHLLYTFQLLTFESIRGFLSYFPIGLSLVDWGNYYLMKLSFIALWVVVALVIFALLWSKELVVTLVGNSKIKKSFQGQPQENYKHLLKEKPFTFKDHIFPKIILVSAFILFGLVFFYGVGFVESLRFSTLNLLLADLLSNGQEVNLSSNYYLVASFVWISPMWYFASVFIAWIYAFGKSKEKEEEIVENHFAVSVN